MIYDIVIIGAGPAGLMAASFSQGKVLLLESNDSIGKKLKISGAGQCNYTHAGDINDFLTRYGKHGKFLKSALYNFNNQATIDFFADHNILSTENENGKIFPKSLLSEDIIKMFYKILNEKKIHLGFNDKVIDITIDENSDEEDNLFIVKTNKHNHMTRKIIVTSGGKSFAKTGSDGSIFPIIEKLGISVSSLYPALTPIYVRNYDMNDLSGISFANCQISLYRDKKKIESNTGDLLLTHKNLSGPIILDFSRYVRTNDSIKINFLGINKDIFREEIKNKINNGKNKPIKSILKEYKLANRFIDFILYKTAISSEITCSNIKRTQINSLIDNICDYEYEVECVGSFDMAMATSGGVDLKLINKKTMESKEVRGIYFAGEVMDIDGDTGGYNIQAAFSTGRLAALNASK